MLLESDNIPATEETPEPAPKATKKKSKTKSPAPAASKEPAGYISVRLKDIVLPDTWNRDKPGNISALVNSIKDIGQLDPLKVAAHPDKPGKLILVDGRRRYMALQELQMQDAKVTICDSTADAETVAAVTNINRQEHTTMECARIIMSHAEKGLSNRAISKLMGWTESYVSQYKALYDLPPDVQDLLSKERLSLTQARVLQRVNEEAHSTFFYRLLEKMLEGKLNTVDADEQVNAHLAKSEQKQKDAKKAKGDTTGEDTKSKKRGRPQTATADTYDDRRAEIKPLNKTELLGLLNRGLERLSRTKSNKNKLLLSGFQRGLETAAGLRAVDSE
jgi:ParB family chromosome partitioning protein